jgi:hypothetical protein
MDAKYLPTTVEGKLIHLIEECGETIQAAAKVLRFGFDSRWNGTSNTEKILDEIKDLTHAGEAIIDVIKERAEASSETPTGSEIEAARDEVWGAFCDGLRTGPRPPNLRTDS